MGSHQERREFHKSRDMMFKAVEKFEKAVKSGACYEAQQQVLTVYRRLRARGDTVSSEELIVKCLPSLLAAQQVFPPYAERLQGEVYISRHMPGA